MALISHGLGQQVKALSVAGYRFSTFLLDALLPPQCLSCRTLVLAPDLLCPDCWNAVSFIDGPICACCGLPFDFQIEAGALCTACLRQRPSFDHARSVFRYDDASRNLILGFKHADRTERARAFGRWLARIGQDMCTDADFIVPVPLHWRRLLDRRYNQAALLAMILARETSRKFAPELLVRRRATRSQGGLRANQRRDNVRNAFTINARFRDALSGTHVILVDDVLTTGATAEYCARSLKKAGVARVDVLTLARVVRPGPAAV